MTNYVRPNILLVDDDNGFAGSLAEVLRLDGHEVSAVYSGEAAIDCFRRNAFALTLIDARLPGINGVQTLLQLHDMHPTAAVYLMTGCGVEQLIEDVLELRLCGIVRAPIEVAAALTRASAGDADGVWLIPDGTASVATATESLRAAGREVLVVKETCKAVERAAGGPRFDILLLDFAPPLVTALAACTAIHAQTKLGPTIVPTPLARGDFACLAPLEAALATGILVKPFSPETLLEILPALAGSRGAPPRNTG